MALKITLIIGILGFLPLFIVLWKRSRINKLKKYGDLVMGTILEVNEHRGYKGSVYYRALIEYPVFNRSPLQGHYAFAGRKGLDTFYKGKKLEIVYHKDKPEKFIPNDDIQNKGILIFTLIIAIGYIILSFFLYDFLKAEGLS
jgi:hypothetical protein